MPRRGEEITNDDVIEFINANIPMNKGMKVVSRFMTDGSWEKADIAKRKQMIILLFRKHFLKCNSF